MGCQKFLKAGRGMLIYLFFFYLKDKKAFVTLLINHYTCEQKNCKLLFVYPRSIWEFVSSMKGSKFYEGCFCH